MAKTTRITGGNGNGNKMLKIVLGSIGGMTVFAGIVAGLVETRLGCKQNAAAIQEMKVNIKDHNARQTVQFEKITESLHNIEVQQATIRQKQDSVLEKIDDLNK